MGIEPVWDLEPGSILGRDSATAPCGCVHADPRHNHQRGEMAKLKILDRMSVHSSWRALREEIT